MRIQSRALLDDIMRALAKILKLNGLDEELSNGSAIFRERLDKGCRSFPKSATPDEIQIDNSRRRAVLVSLLSNQVRTRKGKAIMPKDRTSLQAGLVSILDSPHAMDALTRRRHPIRLDGNCSAHTVHSITHLQEQLKAKKHLFSASSRGAMEVLTQFFINLPETVPPLVSAPGEEPSTPPAT